jgi:hypothetical protein
VRLPSRTAAWTFLPNLDPDPQTLDPDPFVQFCSRGVTGDKEILWTLAQAHTNCLLSLSLRTILPTGLMTVDVHSASLLQLLWSMLSLPTGGERERKNHTHKHTHTQTSLLFVLTKRRIHSDHHIDNLCTHRKVFPCLKSIRHPLFSVVSFSSGVLFVVLSHVGTLCPTHGVFLFYSSFISLSCYRISS